MKGLSSVSQQHMLMAICPCCYVLKSLQLRLNLSLFWRPLFNFSLFFFLTKIYEQSRISLALKIQNFMLQDWEKLWLTIYLSFSAHKGESTGYEIALHVLPVAQSNPPRLKLFIPPRHEAEVADLQTAHTQQHAHKHAQRGSLTVIFMHQKTKRLNYDSALARMRAS